MKQPRTSVVDYIARALARQASSLVTAYIGSVSVPSLAINIGSITVPAPVNIIQTSGFRTVGKGAAAYIRATGLPSWGQNIWWFADASGAQFQIKELKPDLLMFGGYDDGNKVYDSLTATGTDNAPALNALLYYCQVYGYNTAYIPDGSYLCNDTVHVGYGGGTLGNFTHVDLIGTGPSYQAYGPQVPFAGSQLIFTQTDRPGINIQGGRNTTIKGITIVGKFSKYAIDNFLAFNNGTLATQPKVDDREIGNWWDPALSPMQDGRYTPYAAITIDAFSGGGGMGGVGGSSRPVAVARVAVTAYVYGDTILANGNVYVCRFSGTSSAGAGPTGTGTAITDGTATWAYLGVYDGANPSQFVSYPDISYPAYTGIVTQYGKGQSSKVSVINCNIDGWIAAIAGQPCNYDGNGDFVSVKDCLVQYCKYFITIGNGQSRNVYIEGCTGQQIHTFMEGLTHGKRGARYQGPVINVSLSNTMQLINGGGTGLAPIDFYDCYIEELDRIGNLTGANGGCVNFHGGDLYLTGITYQNSRGIPDNHFSGSSTRQYHNGIVSSSALCFYGTLLAYSGVCTLMTQKLVMIGGESRDVDVDSTAPAYYCAAHNALAGGIVTAEFGTRPTSNSQVYLAHNFRVRSISTGSQGGTFGITNGVFSAATRDIGSPIYCRQLQASGIDTPVEVERSFRSLPKSQFPDLTLTGLLLQGTFASAATVADHNNILPGDVLVDALTGKTFFVYSFDPATKIMKAVLRNGYSGPAGSEVQTGTAMSLSSGTFNTCTGRVYTPTAPIYVTAQASKTFVGDTASTILLANVVGASDLLIGRKITGTGIPANTFVLGVDGTNVLISNAATATASGITFTIGTASTVLTDAGDITSTTGNLTSVIAVGDYFGAESTIASLMDSNSGAKISAFDNTARTITSTSNALWPPRTKFRLTSMRAAPPTNAVSP